MLSKLAALCHQGVQGQVDWLPTETIGTRRLLKSLIKGVIPQLLIDVSSRSGRMDWGSEGELLKAGTHACDYKSISFTSTLFTLSQDPQLSTVEDSML